MNALRDPDLRLHRVLLGSIELLMRNCCLIHSNKQLDRPARFIDTQMVAAVSMRWLVRNTSVLPVSGSMNRMRRSAQEGALVWLLGSTMV
jgi:hypothetical protein